MGGNALIGPHRAQSIDLNKVSREQIVPVLNQFLSNIRNSFGKSQNDSLWGKNFLSGSSLHFFDLTIPTSEFVKVKDQIGDIDTQVDKTKKDKVLNWLANIKDQTFLGFEDKGNQIITIWYLPKYQLNIQIDLELVEYYNGEPSEWAKFSHSSPWIDLENGIKGVFHKYLMRSFTTNTLRDRYIQRPRSIKYERSTDIAFSVDYGMRLKYQTIGVYHTGLQGRLPLYTEIAVKNSQYINSIDGMFSLIFNKRYSKKDLSLFQSFIGGLELASTLPVDAQEKIVNGFIRTLDEQQLYRDDPARDQREKAHALNTMLKYLKSSSIVASPRQSITHLQKMKDEEFQELLSYINGNLQGKKITLKIDGFGARFGKDREGRLFFESSRSGPIFESNAFSKHAIQQGFTGPKLSRAKHYDQVFDLIINSKFIQSLPNNTKVVCEILYNPMAELTDQGLKFVTVTYDPDKLGSVMSIVPLYAEISSTGLEHTNSEQIKESLIGVEENGIKFLDNRLSYSGPIDIGNIDDKEELADYIINHKNILGKDRYGPEIEGIVLYRNNLPPVKITTDSFKSKISKKKNHIAFCYGRFQPPHLGHKLLMETTAKEGQGHYEIYTSLTEDSKKNPLGYEEKIKFIKSMFPDVSDHVVEDKSLNTIMKVVVNLYSRGYRSVTLVAGTEEIESFKNLLESYNGKIAAHGFYKFDTLKFVANQSPDIHATEIRAAALHEDFETFAKLTQAGVLTSELYQAVRSKITVNKVSRGKNNEKRIASTTVRTNNSSRRSSISRSKSQKATP